MSMLRPKRGISMTRAFSRRAEASSSPKMGCDTRCLTADIDFFCNVSSADNKCREESAKLLGFLIRNCEQLILPYIAPVHKALLARLLEGTGVNANNGIISGVLVTVEDLARVEYNDTLLITYLAMFTDCSSTMNEIVDKFNITYDRHARRGGRSAFI